MHRIPQFYIYYILGWEMSINNLSIFELLIFLPRLSIQHRLDDKDFQVAHFPYCFRRSTSTLVVKIDLVPIQHTSANSLRHIYFSIVEHFIDVVESLLGVTRSRICDECAEFDIPIYRIFLLFSL